MARTVKDVRLDSRAARERLEPRKKPYYRVIETGRHLGYYKGLRTGSWLARTYDGTKYAEKKLGMADDILDANGTDVLSFSAAQAAARDWFDSLALAKSDVAGPIRTVREAVEAYIVARDDRESVRQARAVKSSAAHKLILHVMANEKLADAELAHLNAKVLRAWREKLPGSASSKQRVTNDFKAALNAAGPGADARLAIKEGLAAKGEASGDGEDGSSVESKILTDDQTRAFLRTIANGGDDDLYLMCLVLASTGARFAQARRLRVRDVQLARGRIMMPASHKGRVGSQPRASIPVPVGPDVIETLTAATKGRGASDILLQRWRHVQIGPAEWKRDRRGPWQTASEMARPIRAAAAAAELPASASSYSFRHSSIVRALREGLPVRLVAQLHDTSIAMIERNYTRFMAHALEEMARKAIMPMVEQDRGNNVVAIGSAERVA